jgi:hypothetical protein
VAWGAALTVVGLMLTIGAAFTPSSSFGATTDITCRDAQTALAPNQPPNCCPVLNGAANGDATVNPSQIRCCNNLPTDAASDVTASPSQIQCCPNDGNELSVTENTLPFQCCNFVGVAAPSLPNCELPSIPLTTTTTLPATTVAPTTAALAAPTTVAVLSRTLAFTGSGTRNLALTGAALLVVGIALISIQLVGRRRV